MKQYFLKINSLFKKKVFPYLKKSINYKYLTKIKEKNFLNPIFKSSFIRRKDQEFVRKYIPFKGNTKKNINKKFFYNFKDLNFKKLKKLTPENAILYSFFSIGVLTSSIVFLLITKPLNNKNSQIFEEIKISRTKKENINKLSLELMELKKSKKKINNDTLFLINLIGGTENLDTLTASLNKIALDNKVSINFFEPKGIKRKEPNIQKPINSSENSGINPPTDNLNENQTTNKEDLMLVPELEKHIIEISVDSDFLKILKFIRDIELLENIVLMDDFKLVRQKDITKEAESSVQYKTTFSAFGRIKSVSPDSLNSENK
tara:strand:+ start:18 stop:971 length:954 start_codon:yes stop_codon:yes gene_type:complete